ncbi:MAG TPA: nitronate monooxygenase [Anaeromyxobacter sp.]|nr:nitronate monooxygenase [Anaeromyxobacter sp.]
MPHPFLASLGVDHPIVLAPLGGGPSTPELVAAVSGAGGLGILGAPYLSPDELGDACARIRERTARPFGVNLFAGGHPRAVDADPAPMLALLAPVHARLGLPPPAAPALPRDPFPAQLEAVLEARPAVFSFTFGVPPPEAMAALRARGIRTIGTATTEDEARALEAAGADAVMAQGAEAGGHRGTFLGPFEEAMIPTLRLVRAVSRAVRLPVVAAGGLMSGADVAAALRAGAAAAALGTAFLACDESGAPAAYRQALLEARTDRTVVTRAFSGRPARGLENGFVRLLAGRDDAILPYPLQNALTRAMRAAAARAGDAEHLSLWAGQGVARVRALPAAELVARLVWELTEAVRDVRSP